MVYRVQVKVVLVTEEEEQRSFGNAGLVYNGIRGCLSYPLGKLLDASV